MDKELLKEIAKGLLVAIIVYVIIKKLGQGLSSTFTGDIFKNEEEKRTEKEVIKRALAVNWFLKESKLPAKEKTTIKRDTAMKIANQLYAELKNTIQTMTGANQVYSLLSQLGTLGSVYYVIGEFGVRDGMDLPTYLYRKIGYSNKFSKDLDDVNELFKKKGINFKF